jgi:vacuolar protein sorting-associated protein 18
VQKPREEVIGISADPVRHTYWVYTNKSIYELDITKEDRDIWKTYLDQGKFDVALRYAKVSPVYSLVLSFPT